MVIRAHECPGVITVDLDRTQEVAGSIPASSSGLAAGRGRMKMVV